MSTEIFRSHPSLRRAFSLAVNTILWIAAFSAIYLICSRRFLDLADEGFYATSAWLSYSGNGNLPVSALLMNFGKLLGLPYLFVKDVSILDFRLLSLDSWYLIHFWFVTALCGRMGLAIHPAWRHALCFSGLYVFLIPSLSYQNMPYMFTLAGFAIALQMSVVKHRLGIILSFLCPFAPALGIVAYSPFAAMAPGLLAVLYCLVRRKERFSAFGFVVGILGSLILLGFVFADAVSVDYRAALSFLNSEAEYTSTGRVFAQLGLLLRGTVISLAVGMVISAVGLLLNRYQLFSPRLATTFVLAGYLIFAAGCLLNALLFTKCDLTCDATIFALIDVTIAALPVLVTLTVLSDSPTRQELVAFVTTYTVVGFFIAGLSYAPYQYNLKYISPAVLATLFLVSFRLVQPLRKPIGVIALLAFSIFSITTTRVIALSSYGASNMWRSTTSLPGSKLRGLYGEPSRVASLLKLEEVYRQRKCAAVFFASIDSLSLPYFLFSRKPPFPHAWVAQRVPASRERISAEKTGCILMQDRALPGTAEDAVTMLGYLRLGSPDRFTVDPIGENIFLFRFDRH